MKVFLVNPGMIDRYIYELASELSEAGASIFLFGGTSYCGKNINFNNFNYYNHFFDVNKVRPSYVKKMIKALLYIFLQFYILRSIKKEKPDIIHLQWSRMPVLDSIFIRVFEKYAPIVFTLHNTILNHGDKSVFQNLVNYGFKSFLKTTSSIILHTTYSKQKFIKDHPEFAAKVEIVPHGVLSFPPIKGKRKFSFASDSEKVLLFFGLIEKYKGLDILINALPYLKDENIKLLVAGRPQIPLYPFKKLSQELGVSDKIYWHTFFIEDEDVEEIFDNADLVVLPYRHVDQSGILMTAINYAKPIVASDTGGFSEIIQNGKHGYLFRPEDSEDLALKLLKVFQDNKMDDISNELVLLKQSWKSWKEISYNTLRIYKKLLSI